MLLVLIYLCVHVNLVNKLLSTAKLKLKFKKLHLKKNAIKKKKNSSYN